MSAFAVSAFYKFVDLEDPARLRGILEPLGREHGILGTILLAPEGINATISANPAGLDAFMQKLRALRPFSDLEEKRSTAGEAPFLRFKVRLKKEIVTLGVEGADPRTAVGTYVEPEKWNELIGDPETILVDTRNDYEVAIGRFKGAVDPQTPSFRDFPKWAEANLTDKKDRKIAMYCTGGIRCEKATSLLKQMGYDQVYHLKGGILKYLEKIDPDSSAWEGSCFVFDQRVGVEHGLRESDYGLCHGCRHPLSPEERQDPLFEEGVSCPHCAASLSPEKKERLRERQRQMRLAGERGYQHLGTDPKSKKEKHVE